MHASPAPLPELDEFLSAFQVRFRRPEGEEALERSLTGRLTALPNKHGDTMAQAVPGPSAQRLQELLPHRPWDHDDLKRQRVEQRIAAATVGQGALLLDATGVAKQGNASVGVARQYAGTLGKVGPCQVAVPGGSREARASWPVAVRLSLPKAWMAAPERLRRARVPAAVRLQTPPELALDLLAQARAWGMPDRYVGAEADDGDHPNSLAGVAARRQRYVVAVRSDCEGRQKRRDALPTQRAEPVWAAWPRCQWRPRRWRQGKKGWRRQKCVARRCWRMTSQGEARIGWWWGERAARGPPEERKDYWSTRSAAAPLAELVDSAHRRQALEQCPEEAKGEWGGEQYQGRWWPGVHRHAVSAMLAYSVLLGQELRHPQH